MEKVKLTQPQADSLEHFLKLHESKYEMIYAMHTDPEPWRSPLDALTGEQITNALYYGYEVEQTPEDKVREYINSRRKEMKSLVEQTPHHTRAKYKREGALEVAKILGIEGVEIHE